MGGAARVELCDNLYAGGTTPSAGTIRLARKYLSIALHVLIRPRGGDFLYSAHELEIMKDDIRFCKEIGVDGVVIGILKSDGTIDTERTAQLIELARPMYVTFHRAFDMCRNATEALEQLIRLNVDCLLTSGQKNKASDGVELIAQLVEQAAGRIQIMPGAGVNADTIRWLKKRTGATAFHMSAQSLINSDMTYRTEDVRLGGLPQIPEYQHAVSDTEKIRLIVSKDKELTIDARPEPAEGDCKM
jgi:copper homeostasis protein